MTFIMNQNAHYFVINCEFDMNKTYGCTQYKSLADLYKAYCDLTESDLEEIEGAEFTITQNAETKAYFLSCDWGWGTSVINFDDINLATGEPSKHIEEYVSEFVM